MAVLYILKYLLKLYILKDKKKKKSMIQFFPRKQNEDFYPCKQTANRLTPHKTKNQGYNTLKIKSVSILTQNSLRNYANYGDEEDLKINRDAVFLFPPRLFKAAYGVS